MHVEAVDPFVFRLSIFALAVFVGYFVVWSVTPALHTPLMSVTNAISSVIVVGALLAVGVPLETNDSGPIWARALGFVALVFASVNIFGGFLVIQRMLGMYQKKNKRCAHTLAPGITALGLLAVGVPHAATRVRDRHEDHASMNADLAGLFYVV